MALSILLPAVSLCKGREAGEKYVQELLGRQLDFLQQNPAGNVIFGMDACDPASCILANRLATSTGLQRVRVVIFSTHELHQARRRGLRFGRSVADSAADARFTPMCWMWEQLAVYAHRHLQPEAFVLLGDDTQITPAIWVDQVLGVPLQHMHA